VNDLIEAGAELDLADDEGWTPLIAAASRAAWSTMDLLVAAGADVNHLAEGGNTALRQVFDRRMLRHTMVVLAALADRALSEDQIDGYTSAYQQLEKLLQAGASPNVTHEDDSDRNLLDEALSQGDDEVCDLLRRFGAEPTAQTST
jgi:ankyrin repeat protein